MANVQKALNENTDELSKIVSDNAQDDSEKTKAFMNILNLTDSDKGKVSSDLETMFSYARKMLESIKK